MAGTTIKDTFEGGSDTHLASWAPTDPGASGWTGWEYTGDTNQIQVQSWGAARRITGPGNLVARMDIDTVDDHFQLVADVGRGGVDQTSKSLALAFYLTDESLGTWDGREYYYVVLARASSTTSSLSLYHANAAGASTLVADGGSQSHPTSSARRVRVTVEGLRCRVWISDAATGDNETLEIDATLPVDYRGTGRQRKGLVFGTAGSGDYWCNEFQFTDLIGVDAGVTDPRSVVGSISTGRVFRVERRDGEIEEWVVANHDDDVDANLTTVTAVPVSAWFAERIQIRSADGLAVSYDAPLDDALAALLATGEVPAFLVAGTVEVTPRVAGTWNRQNLTGALRQLIDAANQAPEVVLARQTVRAEWRRVSASQWAIDILVSAASGTPSFVEGKNILRGYRSSTDRTREAQVVYPLNQQGTAIGHAYLLVSAVDGDVTVTLTDWSTGPDQLLVVEDGQWVGQYLVAPDGTTYEITASSVSDQSITCASLTGGDISVGDVVRIAADGSGTLALAVALPNRKNPKKRTIEAPWPGTTNWLPNSQFRTWDSGVPVHWTPSGGAESHISEETTLVQTGASAVLWAAAAADELITQAALAYPLRLLQPSGVVTVTYGVSYHTTGTPSYVQMQHYISGTGSGSGAWGSASSSIVSDGDWHVREFTGTSLVPANGHAGIQIRLRSAGAVTAVIDRVWLSIAAGAGGTAADLPDESTDNTVEGCGPLRGLYYGNFELEHMERAGLSFTVPIIDLYRSAPTTYAADLLRLHQMARLVYPSRGIDEELPIVSLEVNERVREQAAVTLAAIKRRLTDLI